MDFTNFESLIKNNVGTHLKDIEDCQIAKVIAYELVDYEATWKSIRAVGFDSCDLLNTSFEEVNFYSCVFLDSFISHVEFSGCTFHSTYFVNCDFVEVDFTSSFLNSCKFINCTFDICSFSRSKWRRVIFDGCSNYLSGLVNVQFSDIQGWDLKSVMDSEGRPLVYDPSNNRVFHAKYSGDVWVLIEHFQVTPKHMTDHECKEAIGLIKQLANIS